MRPLSNIVRSVLDEALRRSPTIARLVNELEQLDTLVYIEFSHDLTSGRGATAMVGIAGSMRMLRVMVNARLDPRPRMEVMGHELQHALEIARAAEVIDKGTFRRFFARIGFALGESSFETNPAREIEAQVRSELAMSQRPQPALIAKAR